MRWYTMLLIMGLPFAYVGCVIYMIRFWIMFVCKSWDDVDRDDWCFGVYLGILTAAVAPLIFVGKLIFRGRH